jgi:hypothetical protein
MTEKRLRMPRQLALPAALALVTASAAFTLALGPQPTSAAWTTSKAVGITATAVTPAAVPTVSCGAASGLLAVAIPITWTAPSGATPSRYRVVWSGTAGSGQAYFTTSPGSIGGGLLSVAGTSTVTVYPEYGDWINSPVSVQSRTVTTISVAGVVVSWTCA